MFLFLMIISLSLQIIGQSYDMGIGFNSNIKLLMGGSYCGGTEWNKPANDIDKCFKLYYIRQGSASISDKKGNYLISGPNLYFINGNVIESQRCIEKMVVDWVHFKPESVYFNYILQFGPCVQLLDQDFFKSFDPLYKLFNQFFLKRLSEAEERITQLEIQSFIQFAIAQVFKRENEEVIENENSILRLLPALEFISNNYNKEISLKQISEVCFVSPNYFHRLFSQAFQVSPLFYMRQMRMEEAIRQLVYTGRTVKEIAFDIGYEDEAYFSRTFSKLYSISPGKYRKQFNRRLP
jgi:AraC-like DNA-binding protein